MNLGTHTTHPHLGLQLSVLSDPRFHAAASRQPPPPFSPWKIPLGEGQQTGRRHPGLTWSTPLSCSSANVHHESSCSWHIKDDSNILVKKKKGEKNTKEVEKEKKDQSSQAPRRCDQGTAMGNGSS
jgi:hypothetical protein